MLYLKGIYQWYMFVLEYLTVNNSYLNKIEVISYINKVQRWKSPRLICAWLLIYKGDWMTTRISSPWEGQCPQPAGPPTHPSSSKMSKRCKINNMINTRAGRAVILLLLTPSILLLLHSQHVDQPQGPRSPDITFSAGSPDISSALHLKGRGEDEYIPFL